MNSRQKGADAERELANVLKSYGYDTRRGQQYSGANGDADVVGLEYVHIECKRVERLNLSAAFKQSSRDAYTASQRTGKAVFPTVMHRKSREPWMVTMMLSDWKYLYDAFLEERRRHNEAHAEGKGSVTSESREEDHAD